MSNDKWINLVKRFKLLIIIILIALVLFFLNLFGVTKFAIGIFQKILTPFQQITYNVSLKIKSFFQSKSNTQLKQENFELQENLKHSLINAVEFATLKQENEFLKQQLHFLESTDSNYQVAAVIGQESSSGQKILILNKGSLAAIESNYPVIISGANKKQGYLVGKIVQVDNATSKVILITNSKSLIAAKVMGTNETTGIVKGERGLTLKMDLIPADKAIKKNDIIITSGLEPKIPEGLIIGEIEAILTQPGDFFNQAKIKPFADFDNLRIVTVLLP